MNDFVEELTNHRKFIDLPEEELDDKLRNDKTTNPSGVFYNVCWMEMHPGYASLRFILSSTVRFHPIGISPNGFVWGSKTFQNLDLLLNDFKKNPRGTLAAKRPPPPINVRPQQSPPPPKVAEAAPKPSRWGNKPPAPPVPPAWGAPPPVPPVEPAWGAARAGTEQWNRPPPPHLPPPPTGFRPPPPSQPPPPSFGRPPPPGPPPNYQPTSSQYQYQQQPPPPPGYPPRL